MFLWVALLLVLFLNLVTLFFFRRAVDWGSESVERRAAEVLRRLNAPSGRAEDPAGAAFGRAALEPDVVYVAAYDGEGRRTQTFGPQLDAPDTLPTARPRPGEIEFAWRRDPTLLVGTRAAAVGFVSVKSRSGPRVRAASTATLMRLAASEVGRRDENTEGVYDRCLCVD